MGEGEGYFSISSRAVGARTRMREPSSAFPPESAERFWESAERFWESAERFWKSAERFWKSAEHF